MSNSGKFTHDVSTCLISNSADFGKIILQCKDSGGNYLNIAEFGNGTLTLNFTGKIQNVAYTPTGTILAFTGVSSVNNPNPPDGYLWCDGTSYNKIQYSRLFQVIQNTYGGTLVDQSFNVPDLRKKFLLGSNSNTSIGIGSVITGGNSKLTINQMPAHSHNISFNSTNYVLGANSSTSNTSTAGNGNRLVNANYPSFPVQTEDINGLSVNQDDLLPPWVAVQYIIKY